MKLRKIFISGFCAILACAIISLSFFLMTSPLALQKILSLKIIDYKSNPYSQEFSVFEDQEISDFIGSIPYRNNATNSWFVAPELKFNDTILGGNGNCSNLAFGAMYAFINSRKQAAIIHLLKKDYEFLHGDGHTVLSVNLKNQSIVLDILEGGIPLQNNEYINAHNFNYNHEDKFTHKVLNDRKDSQNKYFTNNYLQEVELGLIPQNEIVNYFNFLDRFYFQFNNIYVEKLVYDLLSIMFGYYPNTYVDETFFWKTYNENKIQVFFSYVFYVSFHLLYIIFFLLLIQSILFILKKNKS